MCIPPMTDFVRLVLGPLYHAQWRLRGNIGLTFPVRIRHVFRSVIPFILYICWVFFNQFRCGHWRQFLRCDQHLFHRMKGALTWRQRVQVLQIARLCILIIRCFKQRSYEIAIDPPNNHLRNWHLQSNVFTPINWKSKGGSPRRTLQDRVCFTAPGMVANYSILTRDNERDFNAKRNMDSRQGIRRTHRGLAAHIRIGEWGHQRFYQIRKIEGCTCAGNAGNVFPATAS